MCPVAGCGGLGVVSALSDRLDRLENAAGPSGEPPSRDGWELVLSESVAYLVDDERRWAAMARLRSVVGTTPAELLAASDETLLGVVAGMQPLVRVSRLRRCAQLAQAGAPWRDFPSIGPPGVDRIQLFTGTEAVLALDSNALRVLLRWGYGTTRADYAASYKVGAAGGHDAAGVHCARPDPRALAVATAREDPVPAHQAGVRRLFGSEHVPVGLHAGRWVELRALKAEGSEARG